MLQHTFRGSTWRSWLGLEAAEATFARYRAIRASEREYLDVSDPLAAASADSPAATTLRLLPHATEGRVAASRR
jgi:hypothetical protein